MKVTEVTGLSAHKNNSQMMVVKPFPEVQVKLSILFHIFHSTSRHALPIPQHPDPVCREEFATAGQQDVLGSSTEAGLAVRGRSGRENIENKIEVNSRNLSVPAVVFTRRGPSGWSEGAPSGEDQAWALAGPQQLLQHLPPCSIQCGEGQVICLDDGEPHHEHQDQHPLQVGGVCMKASGYLEIGKHAMEHSGIGDGKSAQRRDNAHLMKMHRSGRTFCFLCVMFTVFNKSAVKDTILDNFVTSAQFSRIFKPSTNIPRVCDYAPEVLELFRTEQEKDLIGQRLFMLQEAKEEAVKVVNEALDEAVQAGSTSTHTKKIYHRVRPSVAGRIPGETPGHLGSSVELLPEGQMTKYDILHQPWVAIVVLGNFERLELGKDPELKRFDEEATDTGYEESHHAAILSQEVDPGGQEERGDHLRGCGGEDTQVQGDRGEPGGSWLSGQSAPSKFWLPMAREVSDQYNNNALENDVERKTAETVTIVRGGYDTEKELPSSVQEGEPATKLVVYNHMVKYNQGTVPGVPSVNVWRPRGDVHPGQGLVRLQAAQDMRQRGASVRRIPAHKGAQLAGHGLSEGAGTLVQQEGEHRAHVGKGRARQKRIDVRDVAHHQVWATLYEDPRYHQEQEITVSLPDNDVHRDGTEVEITESQPGGDMAYQEHLRGPGQDVLSVHHHHQHGSQRRPGEAAHDEPCPHSPEHLQLQLRGPAREQTVHIQAKTCKDVAGPLSTRENLDMMLESGKHLRTEMHGDANKSPEFVAERMDGDAWQLGKQWSFGSIMPEIDSVIKQTQVKALLGLYDEEKHLLLPEDDVMSKGAADDTTEVWVPVQSSQGAKKKNPIKFNVWKVAERVRRRCVDNRQVLSPGC